MDVALIHISFHTVKSDSDRIISMIVPQKKSLVYNCCAKKAKFDYFLAKIIFSVFRHINVEILLG